MAVFDRVLVCDACPEHATTGPNGAELPDGWRKVQLVGWVGDFHVCSDTCETRLRARYERPEQGD